MSAALLHFVTPARSPLGATDERYRSLIGAAGWARLPAEVRARFSRHLPAGGQIVYRGQVVAMELSQEPAA